MIKFLPLLLMLAYGLVMWHFSAWRLRHELDARSRPLAHPDLDAVVTRLAGALGLPHLPVQIYEVDPVNGLAAPDGRVFLTRGFLRKYEAGEVSDTELASVIAHELGHVALGHSRRRMIDFTGQNALRMVLMTVLGRFLPGIGVGLANLISSALAARLSRRDEFEADAWASALMVKAGFGTGPQKRLFEKLEGLTGASGAGTPAWLLSHPKAAVRIKAIEANEARWGLAPQA
ncbi:M48 family metallopeptidase [Phaeovulum sp.]|uniref:M48 family metallopeptidase n=1 Tax=Phaeovulum sp. TaxID=2934796 RepID=UPI0039E6AAA3